MYITSTDDHAVHDIMMILYMICNIPWMLGGIAITPSSRVQVLRKRYELCVLLLANSDLVSDSKLIATG